MTQKEYVIYTTKGNEIIYTRSEMLEITKQYLTKCGVEKPTVVECEEEIDDFVSRFKYIEKD